MKSSIITTLLSITLLLGPCVTESQAGDPPPLQKADAAKIIISMGYQNVNIGAIIQGFGVHPGSHNVAPMPISTSSVSKVLGYAEREGKPKKIEQEIFYDKDIGWFYFEMDEEKNRMRIWTTVGYAEVKPLGQK